MIESRFRLLPAAAAALTLAACAGTGSTHPPVATPAPTTYTLVRTVPVPNVPPASGTWSFDIGFVDGAAHRYYLADRTNKGIDVVDTTSDTFVTVAGAGKFAGGSGNTGGPNGVVPVGNGVVFAGDGDSTMKIVNVISNTLLATIPTVNPYSGAAPSFCTPGPNQRVDEMAYDPKDNVVLAINDASCPPFGTFFSATPPYQILGSFPLPTADNGAEQPTWDPGQNKFVLALPSTTANPGGEVDVIDPTKPNNPIVNVFPVTGCNPAGTALGPNEHLVLGCTATSQLMIINAANGSTVATFTGVGGADQTWYNPGDNRFFLACRNNPAGPVLVIIDAGTNTILQQIKTSSNAHSIAVDPTTGQAFVPQPAGSQIGLAVYGY